MNKYTIFFPGDHGSFLFCYQVLNVRQRQLDDKMEDNRRRQQESIESREELLRELEQVQQLTAREKAEEERKRREREEEMQAQVTYVLFLILKDRWLHFLKKARGRREMFAALSHPFYTHASFFLPGATLTTLTVYSSLFFDLLPPTFFKFTDNISQRKGQRTRTT